jgi:phage-related protein
MSNPTYHGRPEASYRLLRWLAGEIKSPPFSPAARLEAGFLLRRLQRGEAIAMPHSKPLPEISRRCHELRIRDDGKNWRIVYRTDPDAIVILEVFAKTTRKTPQPVIAACRRRLAEYDRD